MVNVCEKGDLMINGVNGKQIIIKTAKGNNQDVVKANKNDELANDSIGQLTPLTPLGPSDSSIDSFTVHSCAIVMASATINGTIFGVVNSFGVLYVYLIEMFKSKEKVQFLEPLIGRFNFILDDIKIMEFFKTEFDLELLSKMDSNLNQIFH